MKYIAWLNGTSVKAGTIPECEAHARELCWGFPCYTPHPVKPLGKSPKTPIFRGVWASV
jgi:hypothetical protein